MKDALCPGHAVNPGLGAVCRRGGDTLLYPFRASASAGYLPGVRRVGHGDGRTVCFHEESGGRPGSLPVAPSHRHTLQSATGSGHTEVYTHSHTHKHSHTHAHTHTHSMTNIYTHPHTEGQ